MATAAGITAGDLLHTSFAVVGLSAIIATSALLFSLIKYAGAAYLVYLGVKSILEKSQRGLTRDPPSVSARVAFRQAILTEILNPKTALFFLAFLPQFVHPENGVPFWVKEQPLPREPHCYGLSDPGGQPSGHQAR